MGVASNRKTDVTSAWDIVFVRRGNHVRTPLVVVRTDGECMVWIADREHYSGDRPKRKDILHLQWMRVNLEDVTERVACERTLDKDWLAQRTSAVVNSGDTSCRQGG